MAWCRAASSPIPASTSAPVFAVLFDIEGLFGIIEDAHSRNAASLNATYEQTRGYPIGISIDYIAMAVDDEITYTIRDFHVR